MLLVLLVLAWAQVPAGPNSEQDRLKWSAQAEGAAVKLKLQAQDLGEWSRRVGEEGRIGWLPVLRSSASELVRRAELLERVVSVEKAGLQNPVPGAPEGEQPGAEPGNAP